MFSIDDFKLKLEIFTITSAVGSDVGISDHDIVFSGRESFKSNTRSDIFGVKIDGSHYKILSYANAKLLLLITVFFGVTVAVADGHRRCSK
jgi:hypothetical protein